MPDERSGYDGFFAPTVTEPALVHGGFHCVGNANNPISQIAFSLVRQNDDTEVEINPPAREAQAIAEIQQISALRPHSRPLSPREKGWIAAPPLQKMTMRWQQPIRA